MALLTGVVAVAQKADDKKGQTRPATGQDDPTRIRTLTVRLPITVKEKNKFVEGLTESNFEVYEDGKRQKIERFEAPSKLPLNIALLMDTSNSVKLKLPFEKDAAYGFVSDVTSFRKGDQVLFATFDSEVVLHQDFTDDTYKLSEAIKKVKAGGYTRLYDGVHRVIEEKMSTLRRPEARLAMVVISDGADTASERSLKDAIEIAQKNDVTIFGISTKNFTGSGVTMGQTEGEDDKELRQLCEMTGGQLFLPSQRVDLHRAFNQVGKDIRQEYVAYYTPPNQDRTGKPRQIKVKLVRTDGKPFHKQGYVY
jgi:Ca-activated chloride channel family protein